MRRLIYGSLIAVLFVSGAASAGELPWMNKTDIEHHLAGRDYVRIQGRALFPESYSICVAGSYANSLPAGYGAVEQELADAYLMPVSEGRGLIFSVDENLDLQDLSTVSVWPSDIMLDVQDGPRCLLAEAAIIDLRRDKQSIVIKLKAAN
ncbi:hypothetical protein [Pseudovibrio sp. Tun.PSC04-5.I4]|uniref:hypothetical protein n=1 Tax=Pseudovibrio sp. Tun.PSC04-5.I4 TaxID=1798213 RepID=UPI0008892EEA|nr:hypothetical protein [Pseudovibrio sp. Tun.PSC04-5.I4]SDQ15071.1 hypothetical protein SAMN04515695_0189 [Pseudovibrio sp. Tun.PSC04-5.I4]